MPLNTALLLGAGFSKNWGGLIAREVTQDLMAQLQTDTYLRGLLNIMNFEEALARVQAEYLRSRTPESEGRLVRLQGAVSSVFGSMNRHFQSQTGLWQTGAAAEFI